MKKRYPNLIELPKNFKCKPVLEERPWYKDHQKEASDAKLALCSMPLLDSLKNAPQLCFLCFMQPMRVIT